MFIVALFEPSILVNIFFLVEKFLFVALLDSLIDIGFSLSNVFPGMFLLEVLKGLLLLHVRELKVLELGSFLCSLVIFSIEICPL
jgi:hypothetical protein